MDGSGEFFQNLTGDLIDLAGDIVRSGGVRVSVKTNLGPEIPVFNGTGQGGGIARALGLEAGVIVRDRNGRVIATHGDPPPTEPLKVAALLALVSLLSFVLIRGVIPR